MFRVKLMDFYRSKGARKSVGFDNQSLVVCTCRPSYECSGSTEADVIELLPSILRKFVSA